MKVDVAAFLEHFEVGPAGLPHYLPRHVMFGGWFWALDAHLLT
jgi:hypothetical protein